MKPYDEQELIALLHDPERSREAFAQVVDRYGSRLYGQIRRMVIEHDDANDIVQETFVKAWLNLSYFRAEAKLSTWLYRIALNECLNFLQKKRAGQTCSLDEETSALAERLESDPYFEGDRAQLLLQKAILTLPEKQRMVFNLRYFQEMPYQEMSEVFGTSVGALKASYHHAVKKIENYLKEAL